jgi:hypothetical protein
MLRDGIATASRLGLTVIEAENRASLGYLELTRKRFPEALEELNAAGAVLGAARRLPKWLQVILDTVETILHVPPASYDEEQAAAATNRIQQLLRASDDVVERVPGFLPGHYLACAWFEWATGGYPRARRFLTEARRFGERYENRGALADANRLDALLTDAPRSGADESPPDSGAG